MGKKAAMLEGVHCPLTYVQRTKKLCEPGRRRETTEAKDDARSAHGKAGCTEIVFGLQKPNRRGSSQEASRALSSLAFELGGSGSTPSCLRLPPRRNTLRGAFRALRGPLMRNGTFRRAAAL